jgi:hypothetical protein
MKFLITLILLMLSTTGYSNTEYLFKPSKSTNSYKLIDAKQKIVEISSNLDADILNIELLDGTVIQAIKTNTLSHNDFVSWIGHVKDSDEEVILTIKNNHVIGKIDYNNESYVLKYNKRHKLVKVDGSLEPTEIDDDILPPIEQTFSTSPPKLHDLTTESVIDVLVGYTTQSKLNSGSVEAIELKIVNAVAMANQAYKNSLVNIKLRLVGMVEVPYVETGNMANALLALTDQYDTSTENLRTLRETYSADLVSLISADANYCGLGYVMAHPDQSFSSYAVSVVHDDHYYTCLGNHTFAHELGHNMGNTHNIEDSSFPGAFSYSYGYRLCVADIGFRTVMSYACPGVSAPRIANFSNPNVYYNGLVTGTETANTSLSMNTTKDIVANFRPLIDLVKPTITGVAPVNNKIITTPTFKIKATGVDDVAIKSMKILIDGVLKKTVTTEYIEYIWDLTTYAVGPHKIIIKATDTSNNIKSITIDVTKG